MNALRSNMSLTSWDLAAETGFSRDRIDAAVEALVADGLLEVEARRIRLSGS